MTSGTENHVSKPREDVSPFLSGKFMRFVLDNVSISNDIRRNYERLKSHLPNGICVIGDGPIRESEMKNFFRKSKFDQIKICDISSDVTHVIFGCNAINDKKEYIRSLFSIRRDRYLRVFSQEMIITDIFFGISPNQYEDNIDLLQNHDTIEWLFEYWPDFLSNFSVPREFYFPIGLFDWEDEGPLGCSGYHVGKTGIQSKAERRERLKRFFVGDLPDKFQSSKQEWGENGSKDRLFRMAETIASLYKRTLYHSNDYSVAQKHWEEDLHWLKTNLFFKRLKGEISEWPILRLGEY